MHSVVTFLLVIVILASAKDMYKNPVLFSNIPDPGVLYLENRSGVGLYYSISTSNYENTTVFPIFRSKNLVHWEYFRHLFPGNGPEWTFNDFWAPEMHMVMNGRRIVVYYTSRTRTTKTLSIGVSWMDIDVESDVHDMLQGRGTFIHPTVPMYHEPGVGYIDAHLYQEDGKLWFLFKNDGNDFRPERPTHIFIQELEDDGVRLKRGSERKILFTNNPNSWELTVVEAPWLIKKNNLYYLFYSGGPFYNHHYSLGVAVSRTLTDTYQRMSPEPVLKTSTNPSSKLRGPGHCSVVKCAKSDKWAVIYHAWLYRVDNPHPGRVMNVDMIEFLPDGKLKINDGTPSEKLQSYPCA